MFPIQWCAHGLSDVRNMFSSYSKWNKMKTRTFMTGGCFKEQILLMLLLLYSGVMLLSRTCWLYFLLIINTCSATSICPHALCNLHTHLILLFHPPPLRRWPPPCVNCPGPHSSHALSFWTLHTCRHTAPTHHPPAPSSHGAGGPDPVTRSHAAMCSLSSSGAELFAGGTHAGGQMNDWHSGDSPSLLLSHPHCLPDSSLLLGWRAVFGQGVMAHCCVIRLR